MSLAKYCREKLTRNLDIQSILYQHKNGTEILALSENLKKITKDAWLPFIGRKGPQMKLSLPLE